MPGARWVGLTVSESTNLKPTVHIGISKRVVALAVQRNRIKRLVREVMRKRIHLEPGKIYRIRVLKRPPLLEYAPFERALTELFK